MLTIFLLTILVAITVDSLYSKSLGLEVLFQIISSSNYKEIDIKLYNPQTLLLSFFYQTLVLGTRKKRLKLKFLLGTKIYVIRASY